MNIRMYVCVCVCVYVCLPTYVIHPHIQKIHACIHINTEEIHLWKIPPRAQYDLFESAAGSVCARVREGL
jgi:hypothetical protein